MRAFASRDLAERAALVAANRDHTAPWDPLRPDDWYTADGQERELRLDLDSWLRNSGYAFAVLDRTSDDRMIGRMALSNVVRGPWLNATIGWWVAADAGGRGHATAAVTLILRFAFEHVGLHRVQPAIIPRNVRSVRVAEKVGFRLEGRALRYLSINGVVGGPRHLRDDERGLERAQVGRRRKTTCGTPRTEEERISVVEVALALPRSAAGPRGLTPRAERAAVRRALRGDARALDVLFHAHWAAAYRAAWLIVRDAHAAEDIAQEGFIAAVRALDRFDRSRPFGPWLRTIVARRAIDAQRARKLRQEIGDAALEAVPAREPETIADDLLAAVAALPDEQRVVVVLRHLLEMTPTEIGELLDLPRGTVNSRLRRGLDALQEVVER